MTNNDVLRRVRYIFDFNDKKMIALFALVDKTVTREQVSQWLKKEDAADYKNCNDETLANFLNGLIVHHRGRRDGELPHAEKKLNNNLILRKIKIALNLTSDDMIELLSLAGLPVGKHEISAFFRKPGHKHYRECKDQILRNLLQGLQLKHREGKTTGFPWDVS